MKTTFEDFEEFGACTNSKRSKRVGERHSSYTGNHTMEIVEYYNAGNCTVMFEDGTFRDHVAYANVVSGRVAHPDNRRNKTVMGHVKKYQTVKRLGKKKTMANGMLAEIIGYESSYDVDVLFEDGTVIKHCYYSSFSHGELGTRWKRFKGK